MAGEVRVEKDGAIGWIVFDQEARRNAISFEMWEGIPAAARAVAEDPQIRVVVLRGAGEAAFVAGADISEFEKSRSGPAARDYDHRNQDALTSLREIDKPVIAMIHGVCFGGGVLIALTADFRYAADDARFGAPPARLGLGYSYEHVASLANLVGHSAAKEMLFTGRPVDADGALRRNLVNAVVPKADLETMVRGVAADIAVNAPLTIRAIKLSAIDLAKEPGDRDRTTADIATRHCYETEDYQEGVRAFLEKRKPEFKGK